MRGLLAGALEQLRGVAGVRAALLVDAEAGMPVAWSGELPADATTVAALVTALRGRLARAAAGSEFGAVTGVEVVGAGGRLLIGAEGELLLVVVADPDAPAEVVRREMRGVMEVLR